MTYPGITCIELDRLLILLESLKSCLLRREFSSVMQGATVCSLPENAITFGRISDISCA